MLRSPGSQEAFPILPARRASVLLHHPCRNFAGASYLYQADQEEVPRSLGLRVASVPEAFSDDPELDWQGPAVALEVWDRRTRRAAWVSDPLSEPSHGTVDSPCEIRSSLLSSCSNSASLLRRLRAFLPGRRRPTGATDCLWVGNSAVYTETLVAFSFRDLKSTRRPRKSFRSEFR